MQNILTSDFHWKLLYVIVHVDAVQKIYREEGFRGLWSGTRASLVLAANPAIQFTVYETAKRYMRGAGKEVILRINSISNTNIFKGGLQRLLRISSAHNNGGLHDLKIAQISHVSNFSEHKL